MRATSNNNASDRELLELVLAQVSKLTIDVGGMKSEMRERFNQVDESFNQIEQRIDKIEKTVVKIEHEHGEKLVDINRTAINWTESKQKYQNTRKLYCGV